MKIVSLDFETANYSRISACSAGIALFEDDQLVESKSWLIKPPKGHGFFLPEWTQDIHGLNWFSVKDAPEFPAVASEIIPRLVQADIVIAHNASFDMSVLEQTLLHFQLPCPSFRYLCTCRLARAVWPEMPNHRLNTLAARIGHTFHHHEAKSDAVAAGRVMLAMMQHLGVTTFETLMNNTGICIDAFH
ncbi:3'-5' exonuclease [Prosthecobacter sp.]|uniref:3'-5' exonuclease n=1 Tax=Prosthecobacter sp. TaxID=1965333 RepID=UPI0037846070